MSWRRREVRASGLDDEVEPNLPIDEIKKTLETQRLADKPRVSDLLTAGLLAPVRLQF
jgi:hypothetical protein